MSSSKVVSSPVVLFISYLSIISISNGIQISTPQGDIVGTTRTTLNGREIYAFLGIPFGKPPVGELRFKNPVPYGSWTGVKSAMEDGSMCLQMDLMPPQSSDSNSSDNSGIIKLNIPDPKDLEPKLTGSEDCLYLNVFTPSVVEPKKYPVIFNIHGGGFIGGSGTSAFYGPEYLLDKDVVMVSINYRVGALGFASTEDAEMSGNWGLKDQTLALKWVQENIAVYGGNPDSVTILGGSAGGSSVHFQVISPLSKGLFHRAIAMSGSAHCPWAIKIPGENAKRTRKLASFLGCPTQSSKLILECFRKISPERFFYATRKFLVWDNDPMIVFTPVVESKDIDGAFLTENPLNAKSYVPMITGITKDEGAMKVMGFKMSSSIEERLSELNENFPKYGPIILCYDSEGEDTTKMIKEVRQFYFGDKKISREVLQNFIDLFTDAWFLQCATSAVRNHQGDSYLYLFTYKGEQSISGIAGNDGEDFGVPHGEDHLYLFPMQIMLRERNITGNDRKMLNLLVNMWTNFAVHGNPTPEGSEVTWDKVSTSEMNYLNLNVKDLKMNKNLLAERDNFWQELHKKRFSSSRSIKGEL